MQDLLDLYKNNIEPQNNPETEAQNQNQNLENNQETQQPSKGYSLQGEVTGNEEENKARRNEQYSSQNLGAISTKNTRDTFEDPNSWSPEYANKGFLEESATSIMRGIGKHIIKGSGDLLQVIGGLMDKDLVKGNYLSNILQEAGEDFSAQFKSYIPEDLQGENITWSSMMQPKFWSTQIAEMIPQLAEFIFLSKGGSALAKKGASKFLKKSSSAQKIANGRIVPGTGSGTIGKLASEAGLTNAGNQIFGAVGGGLTGNVFSGMLNAAEVINSNKDLKDDQGNPLYTEEELQQMASGTLKNNLSYAFVDMASWGLTFGGGWKALKQFNPVAKGGKLWSKAQQSKVASKMFSYDVAPIFKGMGRVGKKALAEGFEEQIQESWEEWAKKKAVAKVTGEGSSELLDAGGFYDFFTSKENEATRVISAALGGLGGGVFNIKDLINKKADDSYRLYDRSKNLSEIINKQGTDKELEWQEFHIRQTISDIVIDNKDNLYDEFTQQLVENQNITEEEKQRYDDMFQNFKEVNQKAEKLNVKGKEALLYNNAVETYIADKINEYQTIAEENIEAIKADDMLSENQKEEEISKIEETFLNRLKPASILLAESKQNQSNLIIGKKASPLEVDIVTDKYGNNMVIGGLSTQQFEDYTVAGENSLDKKSLNEIKVDHLKEKGLEIYNQTLKKGKNLFEGLKDKVSKKDTDIQKNETNVQENETNDVSENIPPSDAIITPEPQKKNPLSGLEPVNDEIYQEFQQSGFVPETELTSIAELVNNEEGLSARQEEIQKAYKDEILEKIVSKTLGTKTKQKRQSNNIDNLNIKDVETIQNDLKVRIKRTDKGIDIKDSNGKFVSNEVKSEVEKAIQNKVDEKVSLQKDGTLSSEENSFIEEEITGKKKNLKSIEDVQKQKNNQAKQKFEVDKSKVKNAENQIPLDARNKNFSIKDFNIKAFIKAKNFISKLSKSKNITERENISNSELDNYLNTFTTYNLQGPSNLDKMSVVNYQLKNMFGSSNDPAQVIIVKNLFESVGSQGLGSTLAGTIFIDEKSWEQDWVYMHEMSHILYRLSIKTPETQNLVKKALADKNRVNRIKEKYDDYTLYNLNIPGQSIQKTKGQLEKELIQSGVDKNSIDEFINQMIKEGDLSTVPLTEQKYLIEEMFVDMLQTPMTENFDKVFNTNTEVRRQKDVKKWWGLIRKKGEIIEREDGVSKMLKQLYSSNEVPDGNLESFIVDTFKAVTKGVQMDSFGMDARVEKNSKEYIDEINSIKKRKQLQVDYNPEDISSLSEETDRLDAVDNALENDGQMFYDKSFDSKIKAATRILRRFGVVYNKSLRASELLKNGEQIKNRTKIKLFNRNLFESVVYNLAIENNTADEFIYNIENSELKEVQAFNRYLKKVHPNNNLQLLNSMHFVLSNSKHIVGVRNTIDDKRNHKMVDSLSNSELNDVENVISSIKYSFDNRKDNARWNKYVNAVNNIKREKTPLKEDIITVIDMLSPKDFRLDKVYEQGYVTFKGVNIPLETLVTGFIKRDFLFNKDKNGNVVFFKNPRTNQQTNNRQVYYAAARPIIEAFVNTNRKFSPLSSVKNAENNMEPVRITNNHLTKEVDNIINFLAGNEKGKPTKEEFIDKFSHMISKSKKESGKAYVPNQFLESIYDNYQNGILPNITQYHGLEDVSNDKGSLYKNSTALEQGIEDMLTFIETSTKPSGARNNFYLGNMGAFSDSPRKFFMNMKRINYEEVFVTKNGKTQFNTDGKIINSIYNLHKELYPGNQNADKNSLEYKEYQIANNKTKFREEFRKSISETVEFVNNNSEALSKINKTKDLFTNGKLNLKGQKLVAEYAINSIVNGYNITDIFMPGIKGKSIAKRFKMNSSPIMSVKNPNLKIEPIFFADEIVNGSIAGTDSGMYILKEHAEKFQKLGKGVFDMNGGFKFLNASIEKNNPKFKGKTAYLKGYTTIVDEKHPLYKIMKSRVDKYNEWHRKEFDTEPSSDLSDGTFNHIVIAVPQSSDKSNFSPDKFIEENENGEPVYTSKGELFTETVLSENIDEANKYYDNLYYDKKGNFLGIDAYNFGPQQLMDKKTESSNTPVQMVNSIIVNAKANGKLSEAYKIQELISNQKRKNLQAVLDKIKSKSIDDYKKIITEGLNKEDMNQAQRILLEDNGSLAHPYVNEIVVNQLAKTIRRVGNKLLTPGTYAHQKPDSGWRTQAKGNKALKGYGKNGDGSTRPAEIVLPKHMEDKLNSRTVITINTAYGKQALEQAQKGLSKNEKLQNTETTALNDLQFAALQLAKKRHGNEAEKFIEKEYDQYGTHIGYHVKGDTVIASRVPGHGPSSTGIFETIGFDNGEGNQTMVSSEFNDIIGSDNDGDALFIQTKAKRRDSNYKNYDDWNQAFDLMTKYWMSPEMSEQIQAKMIFEEETRETVKRINNSFPKNNDFVMPFSPKSKMVDYNNTMVSKRNVGPVFNIHKITNMLAAAEVPTTRKIKIGNNNYNLFKDDKKGNDSRNQQSAILANIILDNAKHGFADDIGLDEHNVAQAVLLVNLGVSLENVGKILNSPAAKLWSEYNRNNNSAYHKSLKKPTIIKSIRKKLKLKDYSGNTINISMSNINSVNQNQSAVLELMSYLSDMNSEVQSISTIMGGHNKIHVNPLVLEKQINDFKDVLSGKNENSTLSFTDDFKANPDMQHYLDVAEDTLEHQKSLNPVYSEATTNILKKLANKIGGDLTSKQIEEISNDILKFNTSRLLFLNNKSPEYVKDLMSQDVSNQNSIYNKLGRYLNDLKSKVKVNPNNENLNWTMLNNSVLFGQALSYNLEGTDRKKYISAKTDFVNDSFNEIERTRAQEEFEELPEDLRNDLILHDMIVHGWSSPFSLAPFFGKMTNSFINEAATKNMQQKNNPLSEVIANKLERIIALRQSKQRSNPFDKIYLDKEVKLTDNEAIVEEIFKNEKLFNKLTKGQPTYISVIKDGQKRLYEMKAFNEQESAQVATERSWSQKKQRTESIARKKIELVPNTLIGNGDINLTTIEDKNLPMPYTVFESPQGPAYLDYLTEATINYESTVAKLRENATNSREQSLDAREDFYEETFTREEPLTRKEYDEAMEFQSYLTNDAKEKMYQQYLAEKVKANKLIEKGVLKNLKSKTTEQLLKDYNTFGSRDVYAFANIVTPITKQLAQKLIKEQNELLEKNNLKSKDKGKDVSKMKAYLMSGSTIPSGHPAAQGLARTLEKEYKNFINEKKKYMQDMNKITDALYKERLGYGGKSGLSPEGIKNFLKRIKDALFSNREEVYKRLYGNLVIREEKLNNNGTLVMNYKLRPEEDIQSGFDNGNISKAEKDFYDFFKKTTAELKPKNLKTDLGPSYIPHTSMSKLEAFSSRGLLGLLANSRGNEQALYDVKLKVNGELLNFKQIEDTYKYYAARGFKNDLSKIKEYRDYKKKAEKLLKSGKNEDGSEIITSAPFVETALGFGAINRFANNRSVKSTELPSMDLNKALGDYIHSSLFVNGNANFQGMEKLQGFIDGVLAWNSENNLPNMNEHIQKVWKDYFLRNKRQTSDLGEKADRVILGLTRLNLFYALGYSANVNTGGLYAIGNILAGKYHNVKDIGGKNWIKGELRFWGLDKGFQGGLNSVLNRRRRMSNIMKNLNFMEINVYDEVSMENKGGLDKVFTDIALSPMIYSEKWIQQVHMLGLLSDEELNKFDEGGNYKPTEAPISNEKLIRLEDQVKSSHGRGYQPTDQRAVQMYSWGNMMLQFSRFIPTMVHDRFSKEDVNIYGRENIGTLRAVGKMVKYVVNNPSDFVRYRNSLSEEQKRRLDSGLRGMAMSSILAMASSNDEANSLFWDVNYYMNYPKLTGKMVPSAIRSTENLVGNIF